MKDDAVFIPVVEVSLEVHHHHEPSTGSKSPRRQVPYEQYAANWDKAFPKDDQGLKSWKPPANQLN